MRTLLATLAVLLVLAAAIAPHAHAGEAGDGHACLACVGRSAEPARAVGVPASPTVQVGEAPGLEPATVAAVGAPLGSVPGQSPPAVA